MAQAKQLDDKEVKALAHELKYKYIRRFGGPGHYRYIYKEKQGRPTAAPKETNKQKIPINNMLDMEGEPISKLGEKIPEGELSKTKGPIDVVKIDEGYLVLDGQHRAHEAFKQGKKELVANVLTNKEALEKYGDRWEQLYQIIEQKAIVTDIANKLFKIFNIDKFKGLINRYLREKYDKGIEQIEGQLSINVDYGNNYRNTTMLNEYVFDNIKGMTDEIQDKLRGELQRGILEQNTPTELRKRVSDIFRGNNPTRFNFEDRMRMIVRTEGKRATNMAQFQGAMDSGRTLYKYLDIVDDGRTSAICKKEDRKYGTQTDAIPLRQQFKVSDKGKSYSAQYPPFHVNCRTSLIIVQSREKEEWEEE